MQCQQSRLQISDHVARKRHQIRFDVSVVSNRAAPSIPASGKLRPIGPA